MTNVVDRPTPEARDTPTYSVDEVSRYVRVPQATLRSWVVGRSYRTEAGPRRFQPLFRPPAQRGRPLMFSFTNVVEAYVLSSLRRVHEVPLVNVRTALRFVEQRLGVSHPLAWEKFRTNGVDLFVERLQHLLNATRDGQLEMKAAMESRLRRVEWDASGHAMRLFLSPRGESVADEPKVVMLDPRRSFGQPVLVGTGIPVHAIVDRFQAGDDIDALARDYRVPAERIQDAVPSRVGLATCSRVSRRRTEAGHRRRRLGVANFGLARGGLGGTAMGEVLCRALPRIRTAARRYEVPLRATITIEADVIVHLASGRRLVPPKRYAAKRARG